MFEPEEMHMLALQQNSVEIAKRIMLSQNENPFPETGTLGFVMGAAIALGNMAAIYCTGADRRQRKEFERIFLGLAKDSFRKPFATGTVYEGGAVQ